MLAGNRRRTELPKDLAGLPGDANDHRRRPIAGEDIAIRQLLDTVAVGPKCPRRLDLCDAVHHGVEMLPGPPLPKDPPCTRNLSQIVGIHLASVSVPTGSICA